MTTKRKPTHSFLHARYALARQHSLTAHCPLPTLPASLLKIVTAKRPVATVAVQTLDARPCRLLTRIKKLAHVFPTQRGPIVSQAMKGPPTPPPHLEDRHTNITKARLVSASQGPSSLGGSSLRGGSGWAASAGKGGGALMSDMTTV